MILDLERFLAAERPYWSELEALLNSAENEGGAAMSLEQVQRFHYLYQRASADLVKMNTFSFEHETLGYLETLVARAYSEVHETRERAHRLAPLHWFLVTFPRTFRRHLSAFGLSLAVTLAGCLFGVLMLTLDPDSKSVLLPFEHLQQRPSERVAKEEAAPDNHLEGHKATFSAALMANNTRVSIMAMGFGASWGIGTTVELFYNGVILGAVVLDYVADGQARFLAGWLLPHGAVEIPAILLAGQAGFVLAGALIGWRKRLTLRQRLRHIAPDLMTLIFGVALLLVWAGFIEAFLSQYHEPVLPYEAKIAFGCVELCLLGWFLGRCGSTRKEAAQ